MEANVNDKYANNANTIQYTDTILDSVRAFVCLRYFYSPAHTHTYTLNT